MSNDSASPCILGDVVNFRIDEDSDRLWIVLYDEDYHDFAVDVDDNIAVLFDQEQTREVIRLAVEQLATLSHKHDDRDDIISHLISELQEMKHD